jgi:hypothetical protein
MMRTLGKIAATLGVIGTIVASSAVRAAYNRSPLVKERREAMDRWAKHCTTLSRRKAA